MSCDFAPWKLPGNGFQRAPTGANAGCSEAKDFLGAACGALERVVAENALITQRSLVQIQPPQPASPQDFNVLGAL